MSYSKYQISKILVDSASYAISGSGGGPSVSSSYSSTSTSASYALTASYALNGGNSSVDTSSLISNSQTSSMLAPYLLVSNTSSFITNTSSLVLNSQTSSMLAPYLLTTLTSSFVINSQTSSFVVNSQTSSMLAPYLLVSNTASFITNDQTSSMSVASSSISSFASNYFNYSLIVNRLLGGTIKAEPIGITIPQLSTAVTLLTQQSRFVAVYLPSASLITGVKWLQGAAGAYTPSANYNGIGLFTYSGGVITLVASSSNSSTFWSSSLRTANTIQSGVFAAAYNASPGLYFVGATYNNGGFTTNPTVWGSLPVGNAAIQGGDFTNSAKLNSLIGSSTMLNATYNMSATTSQTSTPYFTLY